MKSLPDRVLVKTSTDNSRWQTDRFSDDRRSWSLYTSKVVQHYKKHPWGKEAPPPPHTHTHTHMASAFLGKYASFTAVDLIQRKKLDSWNFYESNLMKPDLKLFNSLPYYSDNYSIQHTSHIFIPISRILYQVLTHFQSKQSVTGFHLLVSS